jgi:TolB-like protein/DNA-binding winged helix-turn-helix (wHTH) protein/Tfp pilus assembly protein PilF
VEEPQPQLVYEFGEFQLDARRRVLRLRHGNQPVELTPKALATLIYLVERAGQVVEKQALFAAVWPNVVVEEGNLTQTIHVLRRALGEQPDDHRFIVTVPGRGYRFVADVRHSRQPAHDERADATVASVDSRIHGSARRPALVRSLALACLLGATFVAFAWYAGWFAREDAQQATASATAIVLPADTVAVLAFENLSGDPTVEYIAFGIAESVLHRLANVPELTVIARTSSFAFRGKSLDAREIGRVLGARYLVEGSVQVSGEELRVTAQVIDATTGVHVESLRVDRRIAEIFEVEDEIAQAVGRALQVSLGSNLHPYAQYGIDAYLSFLQGNSLLASRKVTDAEQAIERFSRAIEIAPTFAAAYVALAEAHRHLAHLVYDRCGSPAMQAVAAKALPLLERALALDDSLGRAYVVRAELRDCAGDSAGAEADFRKGLALSPDYAAGHERFAEFLADRERIDEALVEIDRARFLDPHTPRHHYLKGLFLDGQGAAPQESETLYLQALQIAPDFHPALSRLAALRAYDQGLFAEGVKLAELAAAIDPRTPWTLTRPVHFYLEMQDVEAARAFAAEQLESVRPALWLPICLYEKHPERAAEILRANPNRWSDFMGQDVELYVLRDAAVGSGQVARVRAELPMLLKGSEESYLAIGLAQLSFAMGDRREGERLAREVLNAEGDRANYPQALALALLGESRAAIDVLEEEFERGWRKRWWYVFEREPAFEGLRRDPRFQKLALRARENAVAQREVLEQMRARSEVPTRAPKTDSIVGGC